ncbi:MAG: hypothetical protein ACYS9X_32465 [Planctomycetota bacterium]|jgi:hypothetical protein
MAPELLVEIGGGDRESQVHRFRNFGEEVYVRLRDACAVDIHEVDSATSSFHVRDVKRQELPGIRAAIRDIADRHFFGDSLEIREL